MSNIENLDSSLANMSKEKLESELLNLRNQNIVGIENDEQLTEMKRQLATTKTRIENLSSELDSLQSTDISETNKLMKQIEAREREIQSLKQANTENMLSYDSQIQEKHIEVQKLKENEKTEVNKSTEDTMEKITQYTDTIFELKSMIEQLTLTLADNEYKCSEAMQKRGLLENMIGDLSNNISELKDCINNKKEELQEAADLIHDLQDEVVVLQMELQQFKNTPLDNAVKGNSLFAEVDDNRLKLKENVQIWNKIYTNTKLQYNSKYQELQRLHSEYASLTKIIENKNNWQESHCHLIESYKRHFNNLSEILKRLEKEVELRNLATNKILSGEMKCAEELISITRKEVLNLQKEVNSESLARTMSEQSLQETKREVRKWQNEVIQLRTKAIELNQTIEQLTALKSPLEYNDNEDGTNIFTMKIEKEDDEYLINDYEDDQIDSLFTEMTIDDKLDLKSTLYSEIKVKKDLPVIETAMKQENISPNPVKNYTFLTVNSVDNFRIKQESDNLTDIKCEDNKENQSKTGINIPTKSKMVNFSQNIAEPKVTDKSCRKITTVPCVHIPSLKYTSNK